MNEKKTLLVHQVTEISGWQKFFFLKARCLFFTAGYEIFFFFQANLSNLAREKEKSRKYRPIGNE